jgi:TPR repeat protein
MFDGGKNYKVTLFWFTKSAEQGHAEAQYMVGDYHHGGFGTLISAKEAKKWYALAAKQGHRKAKQRLTWWGFLWGYYE